MHALIKFLVLTLTLCALLPVQAQTPPALQQVEKRLQSALSSLSLPPTVEHADGGLTLLVRYRTQTFRVHSRSMTGEWSAEATDQTGPSYRGFILRVSLQRLGEVNQATTPQTLQEPYWRTYLDVTPVAGTSWQIYWSLSYGSRIDEPLLALLKKTLQDLEHLHAGPKPSPVSPPATTPARR